MKVIDPGHIYAVDSYDGMQENVITFMKRQGEAYPGNATSHAGTNIQEILRIIIDRIEYLQRQNPCQENIWIKKWLLLSIFHLEVRALRMHGISENALMMCDMDQYSPCPKCGHLICGHVGLWEREK